MKMRIPFVLGLLALASCSGEEPKTDVHEQAPGTVVRRYRRPVEDAWNAAVDAVLAARFKVVKQDHDGLGGDFEARGAGDAKLFVRVKSDGMSDTRVTVRQEPEDRGLADRLQEAIAHRLGVSAVQSGIFGGNSAEGTFDLSLGHAILASENVLKSLNVEELDRNCREFDAEIKGRLEDSTPVRITLKSSEPQLTTATFHVGSNKNERHKSLAGEMKNEFERQARLLAD